MNDIFAIANEIHMEDDTKKEKIRERLVKVNS
jgi:hypothetical protein